MPRNLPRGSALDSIAVERGAVLKLLVAFESMGEKLVRMQREIDLQREQIEELERREVVFMEPFTALTGVAPTNAVFGGIYVNSSIAPIEIWINVNGADVQVY